MQIKTFVIGALGAVAAVAVSSPALAQASVGGGCSRERLSEIADQDHLQAIGENVFIVGDHGQRNRRLGHGGGG